MSIDSFIVPANTTVWVGSQKLDDAFRVDWKADSGKTPLYGWADKKYRSIADGRQLVAGRLIINYRFPGYLYTALVNAKTGLSEAPQVARERSRLRERLDTLRQGDSTDRARILMETLQRGNFQEFERHNALLKTLFNADLETASANAFTSIPQTTFDSVYEMPPERGPFEIRVIYGRPATHSYHVEVRLMGVHLVGEAQTVSASSTGGGDISSSGSPIYEIYNFIAREKKELVRQPEVHRQRLKDATDPSVTNTVG